MRAVNNTNVCRAPLDSRQDGPYGTSSDAQDTFSDAGHSTTSHDGSSAWYHSRVAQSDIGHSFEPRVMPTSAFPSSLSLSYDRNPREAAHYHSFQIFQSSQASVAQSVSIAHNGTQLTLYRRPRKLQKSLRAVRSSERHPYRSSSKRSSASMQSPPLSPTTEKSIRSASRSTPIATPRPHPRQPRKLKKRPSPALPPLPGTSSMSITESPPPVPPKFESSLQKQQTVS